MARDTRLSTREDKVLAEYVRDDGSAVVVLDALRDLVDSLGWIDEGTPQQAPLLDHISVLARVAARRVR